MKKKLFNYIKSTKILDYCLSKKGAFVDYPFGFDYITVKIKFGNKSRIFAEIFVHSNKLYMTFSTDEITAQYLRSSYSSIIVNGWHCPPVQAKYKSTVDIDSVSHEIWQSLIDMSYDRAVSNLR